LAKSEKDKLEESEVKEKETGGSLRTPSEEGVMGARVREIPEREPIELGVREKGGQLLFSTVTVTSEFLAKRETPRTDAARRVIIPSGPLEKAAVLTAFEATLRAEGSDLIPST